EGTAFFRIYVWRSCRRTRQLRTECHSELSVHVLRLNCFEQKVGSPGLLFLALSMRTRLIQNIEYDKISVMSDLAFHTGVENRFKYACLAMRKAQRLNVSACVL